MAMSVLVVDDDRQMANLVTNMLTSRGYEVRTA
jgi:DNA-binding response OmpR family regulator